MTPEEVFARFDAPFNDKFAAGIGLIVRGIMCKCRCSSLDAARAVASACVEAAKLYEEKHNATAAPESL